eukprot:TRINITY_DN11194_c0_g1_i1.p1 TRINITY_DN11194_c0_g1~~TRINITY_DN11194_c0_g1_i1.p1  ORF type:complete len:297 (+),score=61.50 TRINITY_DN11194_c0_g1_i1:60-950(+)
MAQEAGVAARLERLEQQNAQLLAMVRELLGSGQRREPPSEPAPAVAPPDSVCVTGARQGCSGVYDLVCGRRVNDAPLWRKASGDVRHMYSTRAGYWMVTDDEADFDIPAGSGWLLSAQKHGGAFPNAMREWRQDSSAGPDPSISVTDVAAPPEVPAAFPHLKLLSAAGDMLQAVRAVTGAEEKGRGAASTLESECRSELAADMLADFHRATAAARVRLQEQQAAAERAAADKVAHDDEVDSMERGILQRQIREAQDRLTQQEEERSNQGIFAMLWGGSSAPGLQCDLKSGQVMSRE